MPFIVDASVLLARPLGEREPRAELALDRLLNETGFAPALWWFELRNGLVINERRGRLTEHESGEFLDELAKLDIVIDRTPHEEVLMTLARRHCLTVYDAAYLELALREGLPLATLDAALADAARKEGVGMLGETA